MDNLEDISAFQMNGISAMKYLSEVTMILAQYSWIYNVRNTEIFVKEVLENIPLTWCEALAAVPLEDLCQLPFGFVKNGWPSSLTTFVKQCHQLGNFRFTTRTMHDLKENARKSNYMPTKVAFKKQFEIETMAGLISAVCKDVDCHLVLDIGSGLGYLDQILHHHFGLRCIGLDSSFKYTNAANDRIKKDSCRNSMHHMTLEVIYSEKCSGDLKSILDEKRNWNCHCSSAETFSDGSAVMVGLHSCGNLTQDMMKLFCEMDELVALICVGCCYNKIDLSGFPMSKAAQYAIAEICTKYPEWSPCVSGLRLAAHGTRSHSRNSLMDENVLKSMFYRALMEHYVREENVVWHQPKRHLRCTDLTDFETYCKNMLKSHPLGDDPTVLEKLKKLYDLKKYLFPRVRILLVLQMLLQPLWEGFVTIDRMLFFKEKSMTVNVLALWDDAKSSRNLALCVYKR